MFYLDLVIVQNNKTPAISYDDALARFRAELAHRAEGKTSTKCAIPDSELVTLMCGTWTPPVDATEPPEG